MLSRVFGCFIVLCLFSGQVKAHEGQQDRRSPTCTCVYNNGESCNLVKEICKKKLKDSEDRCYVNDAYECSGCDGGRCDCVYNEVDDTVSGVCVTDTERKRYVQENSKPVGKGKGSQTKRRKPYRVRRKFRIAKIFSRRRQYPHNNPKKTYPRRRKVYLKNPFSGLRKHYRRRPYPNRKHYRKKPGHYRRKKPNPKDPYEVVDDCYVNKDG